MTDRGAPWVEEARAILDRQSSGSWELADCLAAGIEASGWSHREAAEAVGISRRKIDLYVLTSKSYEVGKRLPTLRFLHHAEAVRLPGPERGPLLASAADGAWSVRETREAARAASLAGQVARQRREIRELKRELKRARMGAPEARDAAARVRRRVKVACRGVTGAAREVAAIVEEAGAEDWAHLHGNARRALVAGVAEAMDAAGRVVNEIQERRIAPALARIEGGA